MISKDFATRCLQEELDHFNENKTLREFISDFFCSNCEDESIRNLMCEDINDTVFVWAEDNNMSFDDMFNFIMNSLDNKVEYDLSIDMNYDYAPYKIGSGSNAYWNKEAMFGGVAIVNNVSLDLGEFYNDFKVA